MSVPKIDAYRFGHLVVDGQSHDKDLILLPNRVLSGWWRLEGYVLHPDDLDAVWAVAPEMLVVGQGAYGRMRVAAETHQALQAVAQAFGPILIFIFEEIELSERCESCIDPLDGLRIIFFLVLIILCQLFKGIKFISLGGFLP